MKKGICAIILLFIVEGASLAQQDFEGKLYAPELKESPQMVIKLTPPRSRNTGQKITISDDEGRFQFNDLEEGRYLMEIYHNNELIRREVVDTRRAPQKEIRLTPKR